MTLDEVLKIQDAEIRKAQAQAGLADQALGARLKLASAEADIAGQWTDVQLKQQQVIRAHLDNVAKALDIKWDTQAHQHLQQIRNIAFQKARAVAKERDKMELSIQRVNRLLVGSDRDGIRDAWIAFQYLRERVPAKCLRAAHSVIPDQEAYQPSSWTRGTGGVSVMQPATNVNQLLDNARRASHYPTTGSAAWMYLSQYLEAIAEAASAEAVELNAKADLLEKAAIEIAKIDWDRLKNQ